MSLSKIILHFVNSTMMPLDFLVFQQHANHFHYYACYSLTNATTKIKIALLGYCHLDLHLLVANLRIPLFACDIYKLFRLSRFYLSIV